MLNEPCRRHVFAPHTRMVWFLPSSSSPSPFFLSSFFFVARQTSEPRREEDLVVVVVEVSRAPSDAAVLPRINADMTAFFFYAFFLSTRILTFRDDAFSSECCRPPLFLSLLLRACSPTVRVQVFVEKSSPLSRLGTVQDKLESVAPRARHECHAITSPLPFVLALFAFYISFSGLCPRGRPERFDCAARARLEHFFFSVFLFGSLLESPFTCISHVASRQLRPLRKNHLII